MIKVRICFLLLQARKMGTFNKLIVCRTLGFLLFIESVFMLLAMFVSVFYGEQVVRPFLISVGITFGSALALFLVGRKASKEMGRRESFFIVATIWVIFSFFGMLPFYLSGAISTVTDAYFETISGFTTTGATVLNNIEAMPNGLLFWRALLQWLGGIGIIVFTLVLLPFFAGNGTFLYKAEVPGITLEKLRPRVRETAQKLWKVYILLTAVLILLLWTGSMNLFDSVCHAFTTIATGGFSTKQSGILHWNSAYTEYIVIVFMVLGGTNFTLIYYLVHGKFKRLRNNDEFKWYLWAICIFTIIVFAGLLISNQISGNLEHTFRNALFQVTATITSCGFSTADYVQWGPFFWIILLLLMASGACSCSTGGGIKIIRSGTLLKNTLNEFRRQIHPRAILPVRINNSVVPQEMIVNVSIFVLVYIMVIVISTLLLTGIGIGFEESIGSVVSCIGNTGPGLGKTGPTGTFAFLPDFAKWILGFNMIVGRLELFTLLIIFLPGFWKNR